MLKKSDTDISAALPQFTRHSLEASFIVPTPTGMEKSILDATAPLRDFLSKKQYHDFERQGQAEKVLRRAFFVAADRLNETKVSLYRPKTKQGDPRIWFYGLQAYAKPFNLLAVLCEEDDLYLVNASDSKLLATLSDPASPLGKIAARHDRLDAPAAELLDMLKKVGRRGWVPSLRRGDTGVGFTLETLLGIQANVDRTPDFKGIEIKAARRMGGAAQNRLTLFSQVPNWTKSRIRNGKEIVRAFGYERAGRKQLYCTVSSTPNSQGLYFDTSDPTLLWNRAKVGDVVLDVVCWESPSLTSRLLEKHPATMWVKAKCKGERVSCEEFHYIEAIYTRNPLATTLLPLLESGTVTMDYTLSLKANGGSRDHGYLFKIHPDDLPALFPPPRRFDLTS